VITSTSRRGGAVPVNEYEHVFYVDMNALRDDRVGTLLTHASDPIRAQLFPPSVGDIVMVVDDEGDLYAAEVDVMDGIWLGVTIRWETLTPAVTTSTYRSTPIYSVSSGSSTKVPVAA
jgi:hypothetical protein